MRRHLLMTLFIAAAVGVSFGWIQVGETTRELSVDTRSASGASGGGLRNDSQTRLGRTTVEKVGVRAGSPHVKERATSGLAPNNAWVEIAPPNTGIVRAVTEARECPKAMFDDTVVRMSERAAPDSDFPIRTCEAVVPPDTTHIEVAGRSLRPPTGRPERIAVIADTGCRLKEGDSLDDGFQACNDPDDWEFAKVAQRVAEWGPDLIIWVGDYIYREQPCPPEVLGCQGSPFNGPGMRLATWKADFFDPATPLLESAPIVFVRGDHEKCERAGRGFFRFLDPFPLRSCTDFTAPYALDFEGLQLVIMDTVQADDTTRSPDVVINHYARDLERAAELATGNTWLVSHRPIWALRPASDDGSLVVEPINVTVQDALNRSLLRGELPRTVELVLTAHIHVGEVLSFTGPRPPQMVVGIGGTRLLPAVTDGLVGIEIDGEKVTEALMVSSHGFFAFEPRPGRTWKTSILDETGRKLAGCRLADKTTRCHGNHRKATVQR